MSEVPGIDRDEVARFFRERVPGGDVDLHFELVGAGRSNLTYRVSGGPSTSDERAVSDQRAASGQQRVSGQQGVSDHQRVWALRRPPLGHVLPTAHDMSREFRVISALADSEVPVPRPIAFCDDTAVNGAPFYVMSFCDGVVPAGDLPEGFADSVEDRQRMCDALVGNLARLHAVDYRAAGLEDFGRPEGYLERQVRRWSKQWEGNVTEPLPLVDALLERLARALPERSDATIVHGDYRFGNMTFDPTDPGRVVAIFDWVMATLGDPLSDLGYALITWVEANDSDATPDHFPRWTTEPGFMSRTELIDAYATASGRDVACIDFYQVLALTKLAVISEGIFKRHQLGQTVGKTFKALARATEPLAVWAKAIADDSADPRLRG
jgi:aminoglycoside phosphotransferase (APT) family kinase protein